MLHTVDPHQTRRVRRTIVALLLLVIATAVVVLIVKAGRFDACVVEQANTVIEAPARMTWGERLARLFRHGRAAVTQIAVAEETRSGNVARYLYYSKEPMEIPEPPPQTYSWWWCLNDEVLPDFAPPPYARGDSIVGAWEAWEGTPPAPTVTASGDGYLVEDAGDDSYNGQYNPNGETCNGEPVYELSPGWVRVGADAADAALWDDPTKHRYSKFGVGYGGGATEGVADDDITPLSIQFGGLPVPFAAGAYRVLLKCEGHSWAYNIFAIPAQSGGGSGGGTVTIPLPYTTATDDDWFTWLADAGVKSLEVELIRVSDSEVIATDTGGYTMFVPEIEFNSPSGSVPDVFDVELQISEWYSPTDDQRIYLYATPDGELEFQLLSNGVTGDPTGAMTVEDVDIEVIPYSTDRVPPGAFVLTGKHHTVPTLIYGEQALTHAEQYAVSIASPDDGAGLYEGANTPSAYLDEGWPLGWNDDYGSSDRLQWYQRRSGEWAPSGAWVIGPNGSLLPPRKSRTSAQWCEPYPVPADHSLYIHPDADALRVCWTYHSGEDWLERCSDEISITVLTYGDPPVPPPPEPPPGPDPEPGSTPYLAIIMPPDNATVERLFTAYLNYGNYHSGTGHLTIITTGAGSYTLYDADVAIAVSGQLIVALDLADPAADGTYTLWACLTQPTYSESASDNSRVILAAGGGGSEPPTCEILSPAEGASVNGQVLITVEATDDVSVWAVALYVDGYRVETIYAANYGSRYRFVWDSPTYANGSHVLGVTAWDSDLQTAVDSVTVNLANAQADLERVLFTKQLGYGLAQTATTENRHFRDRAFRRSIEVVDWPDDDDLSDDLRLRYNVFVGYHEPGNSVDFSDFTLVEPGVSHSLTNSTIRWALKAVPQRTTAYWEVECSSIERLATAANGDPLLLCLTPHSVQRFRRQAGDVEEFADLSALSSAPVDMTAAGGKVFVAYADRVLVLDEDDAQEGFEMLLPWADGVDAVTCLATDGENVYIAADLDAGGSRIYQFTYAAPVVVASHDYSITAMAAIGGAIYAGTDNGDILLLGASGLTLQYATGEDQIAVLAANGATIYAGSGTDGKLFYRPAAWGASVDFGWTTLQALATLGGYVYAGGSGIGGTYLWYEQQAANWVQTLNLEACTAVQDLMNVSDSSGLDQLFVATAGVAGVSRFYRVEIAPASDYVCGVDPPHLVMKIIKG